MIPPAKFHLQYQKATLWTDEDCQFINNEAMCIDNTIISKCSLNVNKNCVFAKVNNDYKLYVQCKNNQIIMATKNYVDIMEECSGRIHRNKTIKGALVISEKNCKIIIEDQVYENAHGNFTFTFTAPTKEQTPTKSLDLHLNSLKDINDLKKEATALNDHIILHPVIHYTHLSLTVFLIISMIIICILCFTCKNNLIKIVKNKFISENSNLNPSINKDLQNEDILS